ncbi:MAG: ABC transporter permease [Nocardioidaceae bacterium]|nr:ABC transporter permease [Nocardioidaceae bacterium]
MRPDSRPQAGAIPRSRLPFSRFLNEVVHGIGARPLRVALTIAGTVLGTATLVAVLGLTTSTQGQVSERFSFLRATEIELVPNGGAFGVGGFPPDADERMSRLNGVNAAGIAWQVDAVDWNSVSKTLVPGQAGTPPTGISVFAASPGLLRASRATFGQGRNVDPFCAEHRCRVALLGSVAAQRLGIGRLQPGLSIFIGGTPFLVQGIVDDMKRNTQMLGGVLVPDTTAAELWGPPASSPAWMTVDTRIGAAGVVGSQAPLALRPDNVNAYQVNLPPDPRSLQNSVGGDLSGLFLALGAITLVVGAFGIANLTTVSVMERVPEIGLRRALGARAIHVGLQFVGESGTLGLIGGLIGTPVGIAVVLLVCVQREWTALLPPALLATPLLGLSVGVVAGIYPAWRAARIEPVTALQR